MMDHKQSNSECDCSKELENVMSDYKDYIKPILNVGKYEADSFRKDDETMPCITINEKPNIKLEDIDTTNYHSDSLYVTRVGDLAQCIKAKDSAAYQVNSSRKDLNCSCD